MFDNDAEPQTSNLDSIRIGLRIRRARLAEKLTLKEVAGQAAISEGFLSQLERGRTRASVASLTRITQALGMSMADLFDDGLETSGIRPLKKADRPSLSFGDKARKFLLTGDETEHFQAFIGHIQPGGSTGTDPIAHGDSEELVVMLQGEGTVQVDGEIFHLQEGDSIRYRSSQLHRLSNLSSSQISALWIISPPSI